MKFFLSSVVVLFLSLGAFAQSKPQVSFPSPGKMVVTHGSTVVEFMEDGSVRVKSPHVDLDLPNSGKRPDPVQPPVVDPIQVTMLALFDSDKTANKSALVKTLAKYWADSADLVDDSETLGDLLSKMDRLKALERKEDLQPIRNYIRGLVSDEVGTNPKQVLDKAKVKALFSRISTSLEGCK